MDSNSFGSSENKQSGHICAELQVLRCSTTWRSEGIPFADIYEESTDLDRELRQILDDANETSASVLRPIHAWDILGNTDHGPGVSLFFHVTGKFFLGAIDEQRQLYAKSPIPAVSLNHFLFRLKADELREIANSSVEEGKLEYSSKIYAQVLDLEDVLMLQRQQMNEDELSALELLKREEIA